MFKTPSPNSYWKIIDSSIVFKCCPIFRHLKSFFTCLSRLSCSVTISLPVLPALLSFHLEGHFSETCSISIEHRAHFLTVSSFNSQCQFAFSTLKTFEKVIPFQGAEGISALTFYLTYLCIQLPCYRWLLFNTRRCHYFPVSSLKPTNKENLNIIFTIW